MKLSLKELGRHAVGRALGMGGDETGEERGEAGQGGCGQGQRPPPAQDPSTMGSMCHGIPGCDPPWPGWLVMGLVFFPACFDGFVSICGRVLPHSSPICMEYSLRRQTHPCSKHMQTAYRKSPDFTKEGSPSC